MARDDDLSTVQLPARLVKQVEERVPYTEFEDTQDYITFVVEEVLHSVQEENGLSGAEAVDERQVQERLKSLGYLNE